MMKITGSGSISQRHGSATLATRRFDIIYVETLLLCWPKFRFFSWIRWSLKKKAYVAVYKNGISKKLTFACPSTSNKDFYEQTSIFITVA
jgi:hypothetical protein